MKTYCKHLFLVLFLASAFAGCKSPASIAEETSLRKTISYGEDSKQVFDLYIPKQTNPEYPIVIWIHGGGWAVGDKSDDLFIQDSLAANHIASINMNYRLTSKAQPSINYEELFADVDAVIDYLVTNRSKWGLENNKIVLAGMSAGAHLALHRGFANSEVTAIVSMAGPTVFDDEEMNKHVETKPELRQMITQMVGVNEKDAENVKDILTLISPAHHIRKKVPVLFIHGTADNTVPYSQTIRLMEELQNQTNVNHQMLTLYHINHDLLSPQNRTAPIASMIAFIKAQ